MVKKSRYSKHRKSRSHRRSRSTRKMRGGAAGSGWTLGPSLGGVALGSQVNQQYDACLSAARPGQMAFAQAGGLPGMKGGAYTSNLTSPIAGFAQIDRDTSHCNPNHVNPMNTGMIQSGGAAVGPGGGSIAASASPILEEHTARYTTAPSQWTGSTGAPVLLNQPLNGQMWSKACTQTAGSRRRRGSKKGKKHSRKTKSRNTRKRGGTRSGNPYPPGSAAYRCYELGGTWQGNRCD